MIGVFIVPWGIEFSGNGRAIINPIQRSAEAAGINLVCAHVFPPRGEDGVPETLNGERRFGAIVIDDRLAVLRGVRDIRNATVIPLKGDIDMPLSRNPFQAERYTRPEWRALRSTLVGLGLPRQRVQQIAKASGTNGAFIIRLMNIINPEFVRNRRFWVQAAGHQLYQGQ